MLGRQNAQLTLSYGVNDIDGTIDDSTKILQHYRQRRTNSCHEHYGTGKFDQTGKTSAIERDTLYKEIKDYSDVDFADAAIVTQLN